MHFNKSKMNLCIDIGNTQIKVAIFDRQDLVHRENFPSDVFLQRIRALRNSFDVNYAILSHVARLDEPIKEEFKSLFEVIILNHETLMPFENKYLTPETLGVDRLALVAAAVQNYPGKAVLVIDGGSCITYDFVDADKSYSGGSISPGIEMRYKAVNAYTANLPLLEIPEEIPGMGNSTANAIHLGILQGVVHEIDGVISQYSSQNQNLTVVLTGGNTNFLAKHIKSGIFANPNFLLEGLNSILIHNIDE